MHYRHDSSLCKVLEVAVLAYGKPCPLPKHPVVLVSAEELPFQLRTLPACEHTALPRSLSPNAPFPLGRAALLQMRLALAPPWLARGALP